MIFGRKVQYIPTINETTAGSPVKLEKLVLGALDGGAGEVQGLGGSLRGGELGEAVTGVTAGVSTRSMLIDT